MVLDVRGEGTGLEPTPLDTEPDSADAAEAQAGRLAGGGEADASPADRPRARPVAESERLFAVDALRGFALLGILAMNIVDFAWPGVVYEDPTRGAGFEGLDRALWAFAHVVFSTKMMTIFSMLFGAGLVLMDRRASARGASIRGVYYRRVLWLLVIGLIHAYLIWSGDILVLYAECGLVLYLFRNKSPRTLIILGVAGLLLCIPVLTGLAAGLDYLKATAARVEAQLRAGEAPRRFDRRLHDIWVEDVQKEVDPTPEQRAREWDKAMATHRGGYAGIVKARAVEVLVSHVLGLLIVAWFVAGPRMLLGMGLMKLGVFSAVRSRRFYATMAALGYGIGLPLMVFDMLQLIEHRFSFDYLIHGGTLYNAIGGIIVALGHVGAMMLLIQSGALAGLVRRLAAVGRMALTNYLTHSIVCTTLFYGYGFGLYGTINRTGLAAIVLAIWAFQLVVSPIWLRHFRFGPAEWLWRSLTYWRPQPMRVKAVDPAAAVVS